MQLHKLLAMFANRHAVVLPEYANKFGAVCKIGNWHDRCLHFGRSTTTAVCSGVPSQRRLRLRNSSKRPQGAWCSRRDAILETACEFLSPIGRGWNVG